MRSVEEAIAYAIRQNLQEGQELSQQLKVLLDRVALGELTFNQVREILDAKARKYGKKE